MANFKIDYLDHVGIYVKDMGVSIEWYQKVLGLKKYQFPKWGDYPIFMMAGNTGVAIFPTDTGISKVDNSSHDIKIDHFAFYVNMENFENARKHFETLGIDYKFKDHHYYYSIYIQDPDDHIVELTTLVIPMEQ